MKQIRPVDAMNDRLNAASANLDSIGDRKQSVDTVLKVAAIQVEMAKTMALAMVAEAIHAHATATSSPGSSIRYGLNDLVEAVKGLGGPQGR